MTRPRFTELGDAALEERLGVAMRRSAERAMRLPGVEAVLLGGSLGRGEATVRRGPTGDELASDVELYLVGGSAELRPAARRLEEELGRELGLDVSAAWLHRDAIRLRRAKNTSFRAQRTIRLYELAAGSRVLAGALPAAEAIEPSTLPLAEGVRLVLNRLAEAAPHCAAGNADADRWLDKVLMACGDTLLLAAGAYTARYRERATRLGSLAAPWPMPAGWQRLVTDAYQRKLAGDAEPANPSGHELLAVLVATLAGATRRVLGLALEPLETFPQRFVLAGARSPELLRYLPPLGPAASYEGAVVLARARRGAGPLAARALRQALLGRPLSLATQGAALPLFVALVEPRPGLLPAVAEALRWAGLPRGTVAAARTPVQLAELVERYWRATA